MKKSSTKINALQRPSIALITDRPGWALANTANELIQHLGNKYQFSIYYANEYENIAFLVQELCNFDLVHFFYRQNLFNLLHPWTISNFNSRGGSYSNLVEQVLGNLLITTSVHDHFFLKENEIRERDILFTGLALGYSVISKRLFEIYKNIQLYPAPLCINHNGVNLLNFKPNNLERLGDAQREIIVGWTGNSQWGMDILDGFDHKGFKTIIQAAVNELQSEGVPIRGEYLDRDNNGRSFREMPDYYNSIDIYLCASSDHEGTPNPVLEAMACGLPVISTDVGIVPEVFGLLQSQYIIDREVNAFKTKIRELIDHPQLRVALSQENLSSIQSWDWSEKTKGWDEFFQSILTLFRPGNTTNPLCGIRCLDTRKRLLRDRVCLIQSKEREDNWMREKSGLVENNIVLTSKIGELTNENSELVAEIARTSSESTSLLDERAMLVREKERLSNEVNLHATEISRLSSEISALLDEKNKLTIEIDQILIENTRLSNEVADLMDMKTKLTIEVDQISTENIKLSNDAALFSSQLYILQNSRSFQMLNRMKKLRLWKFLTWLSGKIFPDRKAP